MAPPRSRKTSHGNFRFIDFHVKMVGTFLTPGSKSKSLEGQMKNRKEINIAGVASVT